MKKYVALLTGILTVSNACFAYTKCDGGTVITSANNVDFCRSNNVMSWYAAHAWCYANGGKLATVQTLCAKDSVSGKCTPMIHTGSATFKWGYINYRTGTSFGRVNLIDGTLGVATPLNRAVRTAPTGETSNYGGVTDMYALCE